MQGIADGALVGEGGGAGLRGVCWDGMEGVGEAGPETGTVMPREGAATGTGGPREGHGRACDRDGHATGGCDRDGRATGGLATGTVTPRGGAATGTGGLRGQKGDRALSCDKS